jgi:hypothetical protein
MVSWATLGAQLNSKRADYSAINLPNGNILITGGRQAPSGPTVTTCEIYDINTQVSTATGSMATNRRDHGIVLLNSGLILVVGGENASGFGGVLNSCELYDPVATTWSSTGSLATARSQFAIYKLSNGKVLIAGGFISSSGVTASCELYDPVAGTWSSTGSLNVARAAGAYGLLQDGSPLLVAGSPDTSNAGTVAVDKYSVGGGTWAAKTNYPIHLFSDITNNFVLLNDNTALVSGGFSVTDATNKCYRYDPIADTWTATGNLTNARWDHCSWLLPNGDVLIAGGSIIVSVVTSSEILNHLTYTWSTTGSLTDCQYISNTNGVNVFAGAKPFVAGGISDNAGTFTQSIQLATPGSPPTMITLVNTANTYDSQQNLVINTNPSTAGNTLIVRLVARNASAFTITGVTDDAGNTYTNLSSANSTEVGDGTNGAEQIWYVTNCLAGTLNVTIHASAFISGFQGLVQEYSGINNATPVETSNAASGVVVGGSTITTPSITIANGGDLLVAIGDLTAGLPTAVSAPWTGETGNWGAIRDFATYLAPGSTGSFSATFTGGAAGHGATSIAAFQPASVGPSKKKTASMGLVF